MPLEWLRYAHCLADWPWVHLTSSSGGESRLRRSLIDNAPPGVGPASCGMYITKIRLCGMPASDAAAFAVSRLGKTVNIALESAFFSKLATSPAV